MASKKGGFSEILFGSIMPKIYGIGAAIVITGAMFKLMHWEGAGLMLVVGLTTEAIIFTLSAFEPKPKEIDWSLVYPELADDYEHKPIEKSKPARQQSGNGDSVSQKLDKMLENGKIGPELIESLGEGMKNLSDSASKISNQVSAVQATDEYAKNLKQASDSLSKLNQSYANTANAMSEMANASKETKEYHAQVQQVTKNLASLNAVYEMELQDANNHLKAMNKFYSNLSQAMENVSSSTKDTDEFKKQMSSLNQNLSSLNKVYGNMLNAMKS